MTFLKKHWQIAAALAMIAFMFFFGWRLNSQSVRAVELGLFILLGVALLLMPVTSQADQILRKLGENSAVAVKNATDIESISTSCPRERTHRQDLELAMMSRLHDSLAIVPEAGDNAKKMLDRLLAQDAPPIAAPVDGILSSAGYGNASCGGCKKVETIKLPVVDTGPDAMEREIQAKSLTAPRVTKEDIEAEITHEHYFTAEQGARHPDAHNPRDHGDVQPCLAHLTFCVLVLKNGFRVTGESACVSAENFDAQIGRDYARANAIEKMWLLLGFRLADKLAAL